MGEVLLVARSHPEPTQTFHRRTAAALEAAGEPVVRLALKRTPHAVPAAGDGTSVLSEERASAARAFLAHPLRATACLATLVARARRGDKEGGRAGAAGAFLDGLRVADWARRRGGVARFHAQFASWEASAAWVAARLTGAAFSFEAHNPYTLVVGRGALAAKARAADAIAAISEDARARLVALEPSAAPKTTVVRCGVDPAALRRAAEAAPAPSAFDVVAVGSLVPRKGHDVLVAAAARLAVLVPGARVAVVGEGPERGRLEAAVRASGAPVTLLGALPEPETLALVAAARVAVLACRVAPDGDEDGVPVALLEAMALSVPVVSTPVGGIADALDGGRAGLLVPENDPQALAAAIARVLSDAALGASLVERGLARVRERHDLAACAAALSRSWRAASRAAGARR